MNGSVMTSVRQYNLRETKGQRSALLLFMLLVVRKQFRDTQLAFVIV